MNRIERILEDWSWIFKIILVIVWFLWAVQFSTVIKNGIQEEIAYQKNRNKEQEMNYIKEVKKLAIEKVEAAKAAGNSYSPRQYFEDLKEIDQKVELYRVPGPQSQINELFQISWTNINKGYFNESDVEAAREAYKEKKLPDQKEFVNLVKESGWSKVLNWFILLYCRSMLLAFFFYLIRMAERKGILQTILADKKKFVLAIAGWIYYFFKYPNNVIREIVVEAELRRLGGLFRKLSDTEIALVKNVANSAFYKEWLAAFRTHHPIRFQRGLLIAVLGTIILYVLSPAISASTSNQNQKSLQYKGSTYGSVFLNKDSPSIRAQFDVGKDKQDKNHNFCLEKWVMTNDYSLFNPLLFLRWISQEVSTLWKSKLTKKIDHIPIDYLVSRFTEILNQIVEGCFLRLNLGGNKNEEIIYLRGHDALGAFC